MRRLRITHTWRGAPLSVGARVDLRLLHQRDLEVLVDAPLWPDSLPSVPPGRVPELWRYSVAELFIWGGGDRYLELELDPYGHWWLLELSTWRQRRREELRCEYAIESRAERWRGRARLAAELLPPRPWRLSACAIWGAAPCREYAMSTPTAGDHPDFHQPAAFQPPW
ncbi:MAG: hypothetical protein KC766_24595 [Myxococcales bacterium]|nr:hypothetical protein [Myxococcales bacterium]